MIPQKRFKQTRRAMLLAAISATYPVTGYCIEAGHVEFAIGNVESVAANGNRRPLIKGSEIDSGDSISTGASGRAQVRFADGGFISLQPDTTFRVDDYNFQNKTDDEGKGFFSLLKGGLRAITGLIGHFNKNAYQLKTPVGTIGIRGTGYNVVLRDDGMFVNVGEGAISLSNNGGSLLVTAGNAAFVLNFNTAPTLTTTPPFIPPNGLEEPLFTVADQRDSSGNFNVISLPSVPGYIVAWAATPAVGSGASAGAIYGVTTNTLFSATSQLVQYDWNSATGGPQSGSLGTAVVAFSATDGIIGWGRWVGTTSGTGAPHPMTGVFDYITGIPTPTATMPTTGVATYSLMGYTSPTATDLSTGYNVNGTLTATFGGAGPNVAVNMTVANPVNSYTINGQTTINGSTFTGIGVATTGNGITTCLSTCSTSINGFFAGTNAERAGLSYSINDSFVFVQGVAAFTKN
jgi:FecR protein